MTKSHQTGIGNKCESRRHATFESAEMALYIMSQRNLRDNQGRKFDATKMEIKKCPVCRGWHVRRAK